MAGYFVGYNSINNKKQETEQKDKVWEESDGKPSNFIVTLFKYIFSRLRDFALFFIYSIVAIADLLTNLKFFLVQNMFWGRSKFYKLGTQLLIGLLTLFVGFANIASEISKVNATPVQFKDDYVASEDIVKASGSLKDISGSLNPIPSTIPSVKITVDSGDTLDTVAKKFISKDIEFAAGTFGETIVPTDDMVARKKSVVKLLNNLSGDNPTLKAGDELIAYNFDGIVYEVKDNDSIASIAKTYSKSEDEIKQLNYTLLDANAGAIKKGDKLMITAVLVKEPEKPKVVVPVKTTTPTSTYQGTQNVVSTASGDFIRPVEPGCGNITQWFTAYHNGIDIAQSGGCKILATADGVVEYAGWKAAGYGYMVRINHGNGIVSEYAHGVGTYYVTAGQTVKKGQPIMYMGSTGNSTGTHCHFMIWKNGVTVNPALYVNF